MNHTRAARTPNTHRRPNKEVAMDELRKRIDRLLDVIEHKTVLKMIYEIVHWIAAHQSDLI